MDPSEHDQNDSHNGAPASGHEHAHLDGPEGDRWLRSVVEHSSEIVTVVDPDGTLRYANPAWARVLGYDPEQVVGKMNVLDHVHPDDLAHVLEETEAALAEGAVVTNEAEYRFRRRDGSWLWMQSVGTYLLDDPAVGGVVVTSRDVTEGKEAEGRLRESEQRFRAQYKNLPLPTYTWRRVGDDFVLVDHNDAAYRYTEGVISELLGTSAADLLSEWPGYAEMIERCFRERSAARRKMPWRRPQSGEDRRFVVTCVFVPPDLVMVHTEDVTERLEAEERVRFQAQLLGAVGEAVIALDIEGRVRYWNRAAEEMYGWSSEEIMGHPLREMVVPRDLRTPAEDIAVQLREGRSWTGQFVVRRRDGTTFPVEGNNTPVFGEDGGLVGVIGVLRDITERKEAEGALRRSEAELFSVLESITDGFFVLDDELRFAYVNPQAALMMERTREDLVGERIWEDDTFYPEYRRAVEEGKTVEFEAYYPPHGRWYGVRAYPSETGLSVYFQDMTERKEVEEALRRSEERYRNVVEEQTELVCRFFPDLTLTFVNDAYCRYFSKEREELIGSAFLDHAYGEDSAYYQDQLVTLRPESPTVTVEERVLTPRGMRWLQWTDTAIFDGNGSIVEYQSVGRDVTERRALEERLEHQALHDSLTGLPNRRRFVDRLDQALGRTRRRKGPRVAVLFMDLDGFKNINDSLGHEVGDLLLVVVAQRLGRSLRPEDALARFGGDEFVVLLEEVDDPAEAVRVAERIIEELRWPFRLEGRELFAAASIGISLGDARTHDDPEGLLREADTAMYRAKEEGGGFRVFDPAMHERALGRLELENGLRRAVERGEFVVHYQPIVRLDDGGVSAVEALVRWQHPERGLLNPDEFVPVAEESGLVVPMGLAVLEAACLKARAWQETHPQVPPLVVSVNLSATQLKRPDLAEAVERVLERTGFEGNCLALDVTETAYVSALEGDASGLDRLREMGVRISIDDFGTGYSSLSYLKRLPADSIKVDKSFVKSIGEDVRDTTIVRMIVEVAQTLGMEVVAEGVETKEQAALLAEMGCDFAQGYLFSKPLPPEAVSEFLAD